MTTVHRVAVVVAMLIAAPILRPIPGRASTAAHQTLVPATVYVDAIVEREGGGFVTGLSREDFEVVSDGKPCAIQSFADADTPVTVIVLLDVTSSISNPMDLQVKQGLKDFVYSDLRSPTRARIAPIADRVYLGPRFTGDQHELEQAGNAAFALAPAQWLGPSPIWDAVFGVTHVLAIEPGRRAMILITDGQATGNVHGSQEAIDEAMALGVPVHVVAEGFGRPPDPLWSIMKKIDPTATLRAMAESTGGTYALDPLQSFRHSPFKYAHEAMNAIHHSYAIEFVPPVIDGNMHTLEVRVKKPGVRVTARRGYRLEH